MKKIITGTILALTITSSLNATQENCTNAPEGIEVEKALKSKMYNEADTLLQKFKLEIKNYRINCNNSQDMFEQTQISILTYEDALSDLKEDLQTSKLAQSIDCAKVPSATKLDAALNKGKENEIERSYKVYTQEKEGYLNHCTLDEGYIVVFEEAASYDDYYDKWKKDRAL